MQYAIAKNLQTLPSLTPWTGMKRKQIMSLDLCAATENGRATKQTATDVDSYSKSTCKIALTAGTWGVVLFWGVSVNIQATSLNCSDEAQGTAEVLFMNP